MSQCKPCPFCGGRSLFVRTSFLTVRIKCGECGALGAVGAGEALAAEYWNRRAPLQEYRTDPFDRTIDLLVESRDVLGLTVAELRAENEQLRKELAEARGGAS